MLQAFFSLKSKEVIQLKHSWNQFKEDNILIFSHIPLVNLYQAILSDVDLCWIFHDTAGF